MVRSTTLNCFLDLWPPPHSLHAPVLQDLTVATVRLQELHRHGRTTAAPPPSASSQVPRRLGESPPRSSCPVPSPRPPHTRAAGRVALESSMSCRSVRCRRRPGCGHHAVGTHARRCRPGRCGPALADGPSQQSVASGQNRPATVSSFSIIFFSFNVSEIV
jgi:hypothetical protein